MKSNSRRIVGLLFLVSSSFLLLQNVQAGTPVFTYTNRDMMLVFRKTGNSGGTTSPNTLEIDIGQSSIYYNATVGSTIPITQLSSTELTNIFDNINALSWSVGGCVHLTGDGGDQSVPVHTLWVTDPRPDPSTQAAAWVCDNSTTQGGTAGYMTSILSDAAQYSGLNSASSENTADLIVIPVGQGDDAGAFLNSTTAGSSVANYHSTFQGNVESTTPNNFTTGGEPSRSDLYELRPSTTSPNGKYLGYFELETNGTMVFVAPSPAASEPPVPTPTFSVSGNVMTISFSTVTNATYTLFYSSSAGLAQPVTSWSSVSTNITGNGSVQSFQQTMTDTNRFYRVGAQ